MAWEKVVMNLLGLGGYHLGKLYISGEGRGEPLKNLF